MTVHIVGAGPGDPELLTLKAARLIAECEVLVHDRLVDERIIALAPVDAEKIDVGKRPGAPLPQEVINALLVELGRRGRDVVRLKGGDPFVFGRGAEEAAALARRGVPFDVVPGITSAIGVPAYAGIPVTRRGVASSFTVVTGHRPKGEDDPDWHALARAGGTIVILMGASRRAQIAAALIDGGLDPDTPAAAVQDGTRPEQIAKRTTLADLGEIPVESPATIVIGEVAALDLEWFTPEACAGRASAVR